jgi:hypothetical protein
MIAMFFITHLRLSQGKLQGCFLVPVGLEFEKYESLTIVIMLGLEN